MALSIPQEAAANFIHQRVAGGVGFGAFDRDITILIEKPRSGIYSMRSALSLPHCRVSNLSPVPMCGSKVMKCLTSLFVTCLREKLIRSVNVRCL